MKRICRLMLIVILLTGLTPVSEATDFKVIVHVSNPMDSISTKGLSRIFLKKDLTWPNGQTVVAVDIAPGPQLRENFSMAIHGRQVSSIKSYWHRQIFAGKAVPPMEKANEAEILVFVSRNPGAVGYISGSTQLIDNLKELVVKD